MRSEEVGRRRNIRACLLLFLQQAVDFEPIGAPSVARATFRHADQQAFSEAASFACCAILLVDDTFTVVFAVGYRAEVVVRAAEERLKQEKNQVENKPNLNGAWI